MFPLKLMIIGNAKHGKDTLCDLLCDHFPDIQWSSSSWVACQAFVFDALKEEFGYKTDIECWWDRRRNQEMRDRWAKEISDYNAEDLTRLGRLIFEDYKCNIYNGIRKYAECIALKEAGLYDVAVWVDASRRLPLEGENSMDQKLYELCDVAVSNNGTEKEFAQNVNQVLIPYLKELINA